MAVAEREEAAGSDPTTIDLVPDAAQGALLSVQVTLSGTPGTVTTITLPDSAQGVRLTPVANDVIFAIGEDPAAQATSSSTTVAANAFGVGNVAQNDVAELRLLGAGTGRTLRLRSATASVVCLIEVFSWWPGRGSNLGCGRGRRGWESAPPC